MTLHTLQIASILLVFALLFVSRRARGRARETAAGLAFPLKPVVLVARALSVIVYFLLFAYPLWISRQSIPLWLLVLLFASVLFGLYQLPGTILLSADSVTQRFWLRSSKQIPYAQILRVSGSSVGTLTRVFGPGGTLIIHTFNHADPQRFRAELARLSGKPFSA